MRSRPYVALVAMLALALLLFASACSRQPTTSPDRAGLGGPALAPAAPGDSTPGDSTPIPPPPPPPPPPALPVSFSGADTANAGGTVTIHWTLLNESPTPFTMHWTLGSLHAWAGYPVSGTVNLPGGGSAGLTTTSSVPDTAGPGPRRARITVTRPAGLPPASTDGLFEVDR